MKNLYFSQEAKEFFKKGKVRLQSFAAAVLVAGSLVGCTKQDINNAVVITTAEGKKNIVEKTFDLKADYYGENAHHHYKDLITGNYYSDAEDCSWNIYGSTMYLDITNVESIADYLTGDEISKLLKREFTEEDFANLVTRIKESSIEEVKTK